MVQVLRQAARLIVVRPDSRVLLFRYEDEGRSWWAPPGGGLEGDETFEKAAAREAVEELAVTGAALTPLWCQAVEFSFRGESIRQVERFFLMRLLRGETEFDDAVGEAHRREGIVTSRWWSLDEIAATKERIFPEDLAERLGDSIHDWRICAVRRGARTGPQPYQEEICGHARSPKPEAVVLRQPGSSTLIGGHRESCTVVHSFTRTSRGRATGALLAADSAAGRSGRGAGPG